MSFELLNVLDTIKTLILHSFDDLKSWSVCQIYIFKSHTESLWYFAWLKWNQPDLYCKTLNHKVRVVRLQCQQINTADKASRNPADVFTADWGDEKSQRCDVYWRLIWENVSVCHSPSELLALIHTKTTQRAPTSPSVCFCCYLKPKPYETTQQWTNAFVKFWSASLPRAQAWTSVKLHFHETPQTQPLRFSNISRFICQSADHTDMRIMQSYTLLKYQQNRSARTKAALFFG